MNSLSSTLLLFLFLICEGSRLNHCKQLLYEYFRKRWLVAEMSPVVHKCLCVGLMLFTVFFGFTENMATCPVLIQYEDFFVSINSEMKFKLL